MLNNYAFLAVNGCLYYTYGSTANFLFLGSTALIYIYISKERRCNEGLRGVGNFKIE